LARIDGILIIERLLRTVLSSGIEEIIVVLGAHREDIKPHILKHKTIKIVYNKDYKHGQTSSFKKGISFLAPSSQGVFLLPIDYPFISSLTMNMMMNAFQKHKFQVIIPTYQQQKGHPPLFTRNIIDEIKGWNDDRGLNTLAQHIPMETCLFPVQDKGVILSFNTVQELNIIITAHHGGEQTDLEEGY
jgi:CTP:molybdopterin cytidylyltransferase MocA